jgi:sarcosine oxidase
MTAAATYDVIVVGLGGMGSATVRHLADRGARVLGLEQFTPGHDRGSSHGRSRIIRQAYFEDPAYVPLVLRSYDLWRRLEADSGEHLLTITGGLMIGRPDSELVQGARRSAELHGLDHEMLDAADLATRHPLLRPATDDVALFEPHAGFVDPEAAVIAHNRVAQAAGADLHFEEPIVEWGAGGDGVWVRTTKARYEAGHLILAAGAWMPQLLAGLDVELTVTRQVLCWFDPPGSIDPFRPDRFPIYIWELDAERTFYGFPHQDGPPGGVKVAFFHRDERADPDHLDRVAPPADVAILRGVLEEKVPASAGVLLDAMVCMYTLTRDHHFLIDAHPTLPNVTIASPCSGHGFKFTPVIGEILADLALDGKTAHPIDLFRLDRLRG